MYQVKNIHVHVRQEEITECIIQQIRMKKSEANPSASEKPYQIIYM